MPFVHEFKNKNTLDSSGLAEQNFVNQICRLIIDLPEMTYIKLNQKKHHISHDT